jgi:Fibronectin type III domain.
LANDGNGSSGYSSKVYAKTNTVIKPDIPSNVNAEATSSSRIYLTWDTVDEATKYYIYRSTTATGTYTALTNTTNTYYANTGLSSGKTYYYKVRAYNSAGYSDYSDYDSATID